MSQDDKRDSGNGKKALVNVGVLMGRHQAFGLIANRCSAADAECLKAIRDSGDYKELEVTWDEFCQRYAGISRVHADQHIHCFEEYGENYRRFAEIMALSPATFRAIGSAVSGKGLAFEGGHIPLEPENREQIAAAVKALRKEAKANSTRAREAGIATIASLNKSVQTLLTGVISICNEPESRIELIGLVERTAENLKELAQRMRESTLAME